MPKVSICVPCYKQTIFLKRTLDSIIIQSFDDFEVIITDDTPDSSVADLLKHYDFNKKLKYYKNEIRLGSPENWNAAIKKAKGEYIKILHHDDYFTDADSLKSFVALLDLNPNVFFAFCASEVVDVGKNVRRVHFPSEYNLRKIKENAKNLLACNWIGAPSATIYRNNQNMYFDEKLTWLVDIEFYIRFLRENNNIFICTNRPLIATITGSNHTVTTSCENEPRVELYEYFYVFNKLFIGKNFMSNSLLTTFRGILGKYNINSEKELLELNRYQRIPFIIKLYIFYRKFKFIYSKISI